MSQTTPRSGYSAGLHATEILLDAFDSSPENLQEIQAEILVAHSIGATVYLTPENRVYAVSFPFPAYPKHSGRTSTLPAVPTCWKRLTLKHN